MTAPILELECDKYICEKEAITRKYEAVSKEKDTLSKENTHFRQKSAADDALIASLRAELAALKRNQP